MNFRQFFSTNRWWGKILGLFFGYLMAGPVGAFLGLLIGNFFDRGLTKHFSRTYWFYFAEKQQSIQKIFFKSVFSVMGHVAKANGRVSEYHIQMALHLMDELSLNAEQKALAKSCFNEGKLSTFNLTETLNHLKSACHNNPELLKIFMDIQYKAAQVEGLSTKKLVLLDTIFRQLGFVPLHQQYRFYEDLHQRWSYQSNQSDQSSHQRRESPFNRPSPLNKLSESFALLEIPENASKQEVKKAYRRMIGKNHPDKLIAKGLPEEMIKLANAKTQKITEAYEYICTTKGW